MVMMVVIFVGSTDLGAGSYQSRLLAPLLRWLGFGDATISGIVFGIRKGGHVTEYAVLAILFWRAVMRRPALKPPAIWRLMDALVPFGLCVAYAALDEWHQAFVPSRSASTGDVMIDAAGAAVGLGLLWWWHRSRSAQSAT
jgi:VanZ family protein